jgi:hypothetical protein
MKNKMSKAKRTVSIIGKLLPPEDMCKKSAKHVGSSCELECTDWLDFRLLVRCTALLAMQPVDKATALAKLYAVLSFLISGFVGGGG